MSIPALDTTDRRILALLQRNSRLSNADLAAAVGLSPSPCLRRVRRLEKQGFILAYRAVLDARAIGLGVTAFARLQVEWPKAKTLRDEIRRLPQVVACYILTGEQGVLLQIVAADLNEYSRFLFGVLYNVSGVVGIQSSVLLEVVKGAETTPLPIEGEEPPPEPRRAAGRKRR
ncbi:MAG TPA: Lrp/AsnC family transcriptional regulator [Candidatus Acidoferrales bacterium]|nr:Lrp/AsnC family transcriptional regulator [Candidatus Acidoferrales bacterium]